MKIKEMSERCQVSITTLRYYEKLGLFENVQRINGVREYSNEDIQQLSFILTLKNIGLSLNTISDFLKLQQLGEQTKQQRIRLLKKEREILLESIHNQQKNLDALDYLLYQNMLKED